MGALVPAAEPEQRQTSACPRASGAGQRRGASCPTMAPVTFGLGDFPSESGKEGWPGGREQEEAGACVRAGENSALALAKEQKSPPFPLLCSCCRESRFPASSYFNHWIMAPWYVQFCYPNVLSGHIVLISVNGLHPTSIICLRASLNFALNHLDFRMDTVTCFLLLFRSWNNFFVDPISGVESTVNPWLFWEGRRLLTEIATLQLCCVLGLVFFFFRLLKTVLLSL